MAENNNGWKKPEEKFPETEFEDSFSGFFSEEEEIGISESGKKRRKKKAAARRKAILLLSAGGVLVAALLGFLVAFLVVKGAVNKSGNIISKIKARQVLDSRGNPTVEAEITTVSGGFGRACAPSGASTGIYEAHVRPCDEAIEDARKTLIPQLIELDAADQRGFDYVLHEIDGTENLSGIGANVAVALPIYIVFTIALIFFSAWLNPTLKEVFVGWNLEEAAAKNIATMICSAVQFFLYFPVDKILFHKKKEEK